MTWQKSGSLPLFFLEQNIGWYKALPVSDLKVWQLSTRLFESPSGSRKHIVVKTKKNVQSTKTISFCFLKKSFITIFWVPNTVGMMSFIISFTILPQSAERSGCWVVILLKDRRSSTFSLLNYNRTVHLPTSQFLIEKGIHILRKFNSCTIQLKNFEVSQYNTAPLNCPFRARTTFYFEIIQINMDSGLSNFFAPCMNQALMALFS